MPFLPLNETKGKRETKAPKKFADESFPTATKPKKANGTATEAKSVARKSADVPVRIDLFSPQIGPTNSSPQVTRRSNGNNRPAASTAKRKSTDDPSFEIDLKNIRYADVSHVYAESRIHFPESTTVWLKDMTGYLNHKMPYVLSSTFFKDTRSDFPSGLLHKDVSWFLCQILEDCPEPTLQLFQSYCLESLVRSISMKTPAPGYIIMLQLLGLIRPTVTFENVTCFADALSSNKRRSKVTNALCWIVNQSLKKPSAISVMMWRNVLQPVIEFEAIRKVLKTASPVL